MICGRRILFAGALSLLSLSTGFMPGSPTLRDKIGQMIMVGFPPQSDFTDTLYLDISERNLGGVVLFASNIDDPLQASALTESLQQQANISLFIATDQEGGRVARLDEQNGFAATPSAYHLGTGIDDEDSTRYTASRMADWLSGTGINVNLAPVVDVNVNPESPAIGYYGRSFSAQPEVVARHAGWFIDEMRSYDIITTLKHFPGHGSAFQDSHFGFTDITTTWADSELIPYRRLIEDGMADMVMTGHLYNAALDSIYPASLSSATVNGLLRDSLGFEGVVISDELFMWAISRNYAFDTAIELAVNSGTDILLYGRNEYDNRSLVRQVIDIIEQKVQSGVIPMSRIDESYQRIMRMKQNILSLPSRQIARTVPRSAELRVYPNPFNISTNIAVSISRPSNLRLSVFNVLGERVFESRADGIPAGEHTITWNAAEQSSGIYFVHVGVGDQMLTRKITLLK